MISSKLVCKILSEYGVRKVFGNPGTTELPFIDAVEKNEKLEYIMSLHEDISVGAASGYSNRKRYIVDDIREAVSVVNLHTTPGLAHGMGNIHGAKFTHSPVIVITGAQTREVEKRKPLLSGDRMSMVDDLVKETYELNTTENIPEKIEQAYRTAITPPTGPVFIDFPVDIQNKEVEDRVLELKDVPKPECKNVDEAVHVLNESDDSVVIIGDQLAHAGEKAIEYATEIAEKTNSRIHGEVLMSEVSIPTKYKQWHSVLPLDQGDMEPYLEADTLVFIGCTTENPITGDDVESMIPRETAQVHIGYNENTIGEYHDGLFVTGDLEVTLKNISSGLDNSDGEVPTLSIDYSFPTDPDLPSQMDVAESVNSVIDDSIIVDEGVTSGFILRNVAELDTGQMFGQKSGGLGYGLPCSVGVAIAEEETEDPRDVMCYIGDGSYQYYPQTIHMAKRYVDSSLSVVNIYNDAYKILRDSDIVIDKAPDTDDCLRFGPQIRFGKNARSYGASSKRFLPRIEDLEETISETIEYDGIKVLTIPVASD